MLEAIKHVAEVLDLEEDWINSNAVFSFDDVVTIEDVEYFEEELDAHYHRSEWNFEHIDLYVADMETLIKTKSMAVRDVGRGRSIKDLQDLVSMLHAEGIYNVSEFRSKYTWVNGSDYIECIQQLQAVMTARQRRHI